MASDWNGVGSDEEYDSVTSKRPRGGQYSASAAPTNRGYQPSRVVHVRNLPSDIDMDSVMELGRPFGTVLSAMKIKDTQAFLYMEDLKCAEQLVNEYRVKPPKIGWRTVFFQYSQYSRLDVCSKKPEHIEPNRSRESDSLSETRSRRRRRKSRDSHSRRSSSPESLSPPLPDISIPFYMLPRSDEPLESALQFISRPQLVAYPPLLPKLAFSCPASQGLISYPCQPPSSVAAHDALLPRMAAAPVTSHVPSVHKRPGMHEFYNRSTDDLSTNREAQESWDYSAHGTESNEYFYEPYEQESGAEDLSTVAVQCLSQVLEQVDRDLQSRNTMVDHHNGSSCQSDLDSLSMEDAELVRSLQSQYGPASLPCIVSIFHALCSLEPYMLASLVHLDPSHLNPTIHSRLYNDSDDIGSILHHVADVLHNRLRQQCDDGAGNSNATNLAAQCGTDRNYFAPHDAADSFHAAVKRKRYDAEFSRPAAAGPGIQQQHQWMGDGARGIFS